MIETFYLLIFSSKIILKPYYPYFKEAQVPQHIVQKCMDFTLVDPYKKMSHIDELRITDCFMFNMGRYN
jgi:hypothetical protein